MKKAGGDGQYAEHPLRLYLNQRKKQYEEALSNLSDGYPESVLGLQTHLDLIVIISMLIVIAAILYMEYNVNVFYILLQYLKAVLNPNK